MTSTDSSASATSFTPYPYETRDGVVTSWIAITSAWSNSQQQTCSSSWWKNGDNLVAYDPNPYVSGATDLRCWPPGATLWWQQNNLGPAYSMTLASMGPIVCPEAYSTIGTSVSGSSTFVACCPTSFRISITAFNREWWQCYSLLSSGQDVTYWTKSTASNNAVSWYTEESTVDAEKTVYGLPFNGYNIAQETGGNGLNSTQNGQGSSSGGGLSGGDKAGIGVGVALGTLGLLALIGSLIIFMRARKLQRSHEEKPPISMYPAPGHGHPDQPSSQPYTPVPSYSPDPRHEARGSRSPVEVL